MAGDTDSQGESSGLQAHPPILEVDDLTVTIDKQDIIEHLSFVIQRGEVLTILGPNGAGKTILLRALLGVLPCAGRIAWEKGVRIGYVPQRLPYIKDVPLNIEEFFALKSPARAKASRVAVRESLAAVGLGGEFRHKSIGTLSSGQFQRVLIAWALAGNPEVLLFDEPTTGVDMGGEETIYALLARLHKERGLTMLIVTHDVSVVYALSTNVLCMNHVKVCYGPPHSVLTPESLRQLYHADVKFYRHEHA